MPLGAAGHILDASHCSAKSRVSAMPPAEDPSESATGSVYTRRIKVKQARMHERWVGQIL